MAEVVMSQSGLALLIIFDIAGVVLMGLIWGLTSSRKSEQKMEKIEEKPYVLSKAEEMRARVIKDKVDAVLIECSKATVPFAKLSAEFLGLDHSKRYTEQLKKAIEAKGFTVSVCWDHANCDYQSNCGSGCRCTHWVVSF